MTEEKLTAATLTEIEVGDFKETCMHLSCRENATFKVTYRALAENRGAMRCHPPSVRVYLCSEHARPLLHTIASIYDAKPPLAPETIARELRYWGGIDEDD